MTIFYDVKSRLDIPTGLTGYDSELLSIINRHLSEIDETMVLSSVDDPNTFSDKLPDRMNPTILPYYLYLKVLMEISPPDGEYFRESYNAEITEIKDLLTKTS